MRTHARRLIVKTLSILSAASFTVSCVADPILMPERCPPQAIAPPIPMPTTPPAPGMVRTVVHSTDGPTTVSARAEEHFDVPSNKFSFRRQNPLCVTPCVVDLPIGKYQLTFETPAGERLSQDTDTVELKPGVNYLVRAPGKNYPSQAPVAPAWVLGAGITSFVVANFLFLGYPHLEDENTKKTLGNVSLGLNLIGLTGAISGAIWYHQEKYRLQGATQKGASTVWQTPMP